jgi:DNA-binding GntR family transcriptional regulator
VRVKRAIVSDLITQGFQPGDHLTIEMLTARYHVSHMPIREALRQLQGEGILVSLAHKGFRIESLSARYIRNMYDIRAGLESMLAHRAAERSSAADLEDISNLHEKYSEAVMTDNVAASVSLNIGFHDRIYSVAENPEAVQLLAVRTLIVRTAAQSLDSYIPDDRRPIIGEHASIVDALVSADANRCSRAVFDHLSNARDRLLVRMVKAGLLAECE